jgi:hypothetical protein
MRKLCLILIAALALSSCDSVLAYWAPKTPYTLTAEDHRVMALVYNEDFISEVQQRIFTKALPYGDDIEGVYSHDTTEIWMNKNSDFASYSIVHEATHLYQDIILGRTLGSTDQDRTIPHDLSKRVNPEQEALLVQLYTYFSDKNGDVLANNILYDEIRITEYRKYIDVFVLLK